MKKINITELNIASAESGGEEILPDEEAFAHINEIIRRAADLCSARVDFSAIKTRVLAADRRRRKRDRFFQKLSFSAAVCLIACGLSMIAASFGGLFTAEPSNPDISAYATDIPDSKGGRPVEPYPGDVPDNYVSCAYRGTVDGVSGDIVSSAFKKELPDYMTDYSSKQADERSCKTILKGTDNEGKRKYCDCIMIDSAPYKLSPGQLGEFSSNDDNNDYVFFWQMRDDSCIRLHFFGFEKEDVLNFINAVIESVTGRQ